MINCNDSPYLSIFRELDSSSFKYFDIREFQPKSSIITSGEISELNLYMILEGVCSVDRPPYSYNPWASASYRIAPGDFIGLLEIISPFPMRRQASVLARTHTLVLCIDGREFLRWQTRNPGLYNLIIAKTIEKLHRSRELLYHCASYSSTAAGASYLHYLYLIYKKGCYPPDYPGPVRIRETRTDIACAIIRNTRSVDRMLTFLKKKDMVYVQNGTITIDSRQAELLAEYVAGESRAD